MRFHPTKMRVFHTFLLQLPPWCSNLRVAQIPCFAGSIKRRPEQGYLFARLTQQVPGKVCRSPCVTFQGILCTNTEIKIQKEDTRTYVKWKEVDEDATPDRAG